MTKTKVGFVTHGEVLLEEFLKPFNVSPNKLALELRVPASRIYGIINGKGAITADTDLRLSKYFGTSQGFWLGLQSDHDMDVAIEKIEKDLKKISLNESVEEISNSVV